MGLIVVLLLLFVAYIATSLRTSKDCSLPKKLEVQLTHNTPLGVAVSSLKTSLPSLCLQGMTFLDGVPYYLFHLIEFTSVLCMHSIEYARNFCTCISNFYRP